MDIQFLDDMLQVRVSHSNKKIEFQAAWLDRGAFRVKYHGYIFFVIFVDGNLASSGVEVRQYCKMWEIFFSRIFMILYAKFAELKADCNHILHYAL